MVHANLHWTFGPLRHVFASPVFHRWHHTGADEGGSKNFAATFSFLDHMFGTFYMPKDEKPMNLGLTDRDMPPNLLGQWLYPFMPSEPQQAEPTPVKPTIVQ
jgi:sterol desaturase/sphingolipid hydroxylase (fatty acid hydroxylase superfamily)